MINIITVEDILSKYNTTQLNTKNIKEEFLNIVLANDAEVDDIEKPLYKQESERHIYIFQVNEMTITVYDNPMRVVREFDSLDDGHTYKTWNRDGKITIRD